MGADKGFTTELKLLISVCGIYSTYLLYGVFQEGIYKFADKDGKQCVHGTIPKLVVVAALGVRGVPLAVHTQSRAFDYRLHSRCGLIQRNLVP